MESSRISPCWSSRGPSAVSMSVAVLDRCGARTAQHQRLEQAGLLEHLLDRKPQDLVLSDHKQEALVG